MSTVASKRATPTHIPEISVQKFHIAVDNLQRYQFIVGVSNLGDEEKRGVAAVNDLKNTDTPKKRYIFRL